MANLDEIGKNPEGMDSSEAKPDGISLFFGSKERAFFTNAGREITEGVLKESFLLYRVDLEKTRTDFYGQSKKKVWLPEIQIFGRINVETKEEKYLNSAKEAFKSLSTSIGDGGVCFMDGKKNLWIEEYIVVPPTHILNGFIWALWGVLDYSLLTQDALAKESFEKYVKTLEENISKYDLGFWSAYDLSSQKLKMIASSYYHHLHIVQLKILGSLTGKKVFNDYSEKWEKYQGRWINRLRALIYKIVFKLLYF